MALKKKSVKGSKRAKEDGEVSLDIGSVFDVSEAKEKDFDLDLSHSTYVGKSGQAGNRRKGK